MFLRCIPHKRISRVCQSSVLEFMHNNFNYILKKLILNYLFFYQNSVHKYLFLKYNEYIIKNRHVYAKRIFVRKYKLSHFSFHE